MRYARSCRDNVLAIYAGVVVISASIWVEQVDTAKPITGFVNASGAFEAEHG